MTFEQALKVEIGDRLYASWTASTWNENDEVIVAARARDYNGLSNDTGGSFYNVRTKELQGGNFQDFNLKIANR